MHLHYKVNSLHNQSNTWTIQYNRIIHNMTIIINTIFKQMLYNILKYLYIASVPLASIFILHLYHYCQTTIFVVYFYIICKRNLPRDYCLEAVVQFSGKQTFEISPVHHQRYKNRSSLYTQKERYIYLKKISKKFI